MLTDKDLTPELLKKKRRFLLDLAIEAVWFSEGSDFEWNELVCGSDEGKIMEEVYGVKYPNEDDFENDKELDKAYEEWKKVEEQTQSDVSKYLKTLKGTL